MGHRARQAIFDGEPRIGSGRAPVAWLFLSQHSTSAWPRGGVRCSLMMSLSVSTKNGSPETLKDSTRWGFSLWARYTRSTVVSLARTFAASVRMLQCVAPAGVVCVVGRMVSGHRPGTRIRPCRLSCLIAARPPWA